MKKRVFFISAAVSLLLLIPLSTQAYERPPGWENLKIDDSYEDNPWVDIECSNSNGDRPHYNSESAKASTCDRGINENAFKESTKLIEQGLYLLLIRAYLILKY